MPDDIYFYENTKGRTDGRYRFLSNFYKAIMIIDNKEYATVEHYFQSMKHAGTELEEKIRLASTPAKSKKLAWTRELPPDWPEMKEGVMLRALQAKFSQHSKLGAKLLATGNACLHEDSPTDMYWGVKGLDRSGKLLMIVRDELRVEVSKKD
ncbi:MAG: NADAR family protein [Methanosarcinales archaeon]|nr:NADAR family protein [Methanosarcinales archaeon]